MKRRAEFAVQTNDEPMTPDMDVRGMTILDPGEWVDADLQPGTVYIRYVGPWEPITWGK